MILYYIAYIYIQSSTELFIRKMSFQRLVKEVVYQLFQHQYRFHSTVLLTLQETSEDFLVRMFETVNQITIHSKRQSNHYVQGLLSMVSLM